MESLSIKESAGTKHSVFELKDVRFSYQSGWLALNDISLKIEPHEKVALLGPNGSGKSTLLKLLDGLLFPGQGEIAWLGQPLSEATLRDARFNRLFREKVGFVFQHSDAQLFCSTVWEEIAFGPLQLGLPKNALTQRVEDLLALMRIESLRDRAPGQLSGGEKKRVAIAAALASNPDVLLFDEPTDMLDPRSRWELVDILIDLQAAGKTIVTATNDMEVVPEIADRLYILGEHKTILATGETKALLSNQAILEQANLVHIHQHGHRDARHRHAHQHAGVAAEHHPKPNE